MKTFIHKIRVYFRDTDAGGVVYHANYLAFAEEARTQALLTLSPEYTNQAMMAKGEVFVVRRCEVDFIRPAKLDDELEIYSNVEELGGASAVFVQEIKRGEELLVKLKIQVAAININTARPLRFNPQLKLELKEYMKTEE